MPVRLDQYNYPQPNNYPSPPPPPPRLGVRETTRNLGLYNPYLDTGKKKSSFAWALVWLVFAVIGLTVVGLMVLGVGLGGAIVGTLAAIIPACFYLSLFLWLDRYDPEPPGKLVFAFAWGAVIAIFISIIANGIVGYLFGDAMALTVSAPVFEEGSKGLGVLIIVLFFRADFDSVVDGIVYAGVVALGFATVENIQYYGASMVRGGGGALIQTLFVRGVLSPYAHVLFTCMTGIGFGVARETHNKALKIAAPVIGYSSAVFLHSLWNSMAALGGGKYFLVAYVLIEAPMFLIFLSVIIYLVYREGQILKRALIVEVNRGLITQIQLDTAISVFRRTGWVASAIGNSRLYSARRQFLRSVAKLGLCHWHVQRAAQAGGETQSFPLISQFQAEVFSLRDKV
ncbi:MAG TPA: PrsW family intramembrane metalloprotease [Blastocatellia bacterium]|nr:PrsW family intramembrane metalloprotease [Blastocatellia bacterium]